MFMPVLLSLAALLLQFAAPPLSAQETLLRPPADAPPTDRIMVKWRESGIAAIQIDSLRARAERLEQATGIPLRAVRSMGTRLDVVRIRRTGLPGQMQQTLARLVADPSVEYAEPDERVYALGAANDPRFVAGSDANGQWLGQWYLQAPDATTPAAINATGAWDSTRANGIRIAVIDSGIRADHPDLAGKLLPGRDFVCNDNLELSCTDSGATLFLTAGDGSGWDADPADPGDGLTAADLLLDVFRTNKCGDGTNHDQPIDSTWHGTRVAGLIAAVTNNGVGLASVAPDAFIIPVRALGKCVGYTSDLVAAMLWAGGISDTALSNAAITPLNNISRAHVLNLSLGNRSGCSISEQAAIDQIIAAGAVVVASAGNDGGPVGAPANCRGVLAVGGVRHAGTKVGYSNVSAATAAIGIAAPAGNCVNVVTTLPCVYAIDTLTNEGKLAPLASSALTAYTYALLNPGYAGSRFNFGNVGTSFAAPLVSGVIALMYSANGYLLPAEFIQRLQKSARPFPVPGTAPPGGVCHISTGLGDVQDRECSCTTATCGAGLLDAAAAVNEALRPIALIKTSVAAASIGQRVSLDGSTSLAAGGASIAGYRWSAEPNISITGAGAAQAEFIFPATRTVTLTLVVTDSAGRQDTTTATVDPLLLGSSAGGGGALGLADLGALALLLAMVWRRLSSKCPEACGN
jgi:serine protease